jgi:hypothetical protein
MTASPRKLFDTAATNFLFEKRLKGKLSTQKLPRGSWREATEGVNAANVTEVCELNYSSSQTPSVFFEATFPKEGLIKIFIRKAVAN